VVLGSHGVQSAPKYVVLKNPKNRQQNQTITITGIASNSGEFAPAQDCVGPLAPGAKCKVAVTFTPAASGARSATLVVTNDGQGSAMSIGLAGTGKLGKLTIAPKHLRFGKTTSANPVQKTVTLTNRNPVPMTISAITSTDPSEFVPSGNCVQILGAGASCQMTVTFTPGATGKRSASLVITDDAAGSPQPASLVGTGQ
jgi:HYDIN/CFA65/VesB-like, Ig-like domain